MQASELDTMPLMGLEEVEVRGSPNFFERDQIEDFSHPFDMELINDDKNSYLPSIADDKPVDDMNIDANLSLLPAFDNAVDPYSYINTDTLAGTQSVDTHSVSVNQLPRPAASPNVQMNWQQPVPQSGFARQESVRMVMEVLSTCPVSNSDQTNFPDLIYPLTPSPELGEDDFVAHPSPCYIQQELQRTRTVSDHVHFFSSEFNPESARTRAYSEEAVFASAPNAFSTIPASAIHTATTENGSSPANQSDTGTTSSTNASTEVAKSEDTPSLESLPSFIKDPLRCPPKAVNEDSLDMLGMLDDFLLNSAVQNTETKIQEAEKSPAAQPVVVDLTEEQPCTSTSVPKMERTTSYKRRRNQNNIACRESRKKRKVKESALEGKAKDLVKENGQLQVRIQKLQQEVDEVQKLVLQRMAGGPKR